MGLGVSELSGHAVGKEERRTLARDFDDVTDFNRLAVLELFPGEVAIACVIVILEVRHLR
jgi:hypothetical protein